MSGLGARGSGLGTRRTRLETVTLPETRTSAPARTPSPEPPSPEPRLEHPGHFAFRNPGSPAGRGSGNRFPCAPAAAAPSFAAGLAQPGGGRRGGTGFRHAKCGGCGRTAADRRRARRMLTPEAKASSPRWKAGISVCSLSSFRSRCRERPRHRRAAPRQRPGHPRDPPFSERAGAAERLAAMGHPAALARDAAILRQGRRRPDRQPGRGHVGLRLRPPRRTRRAAAEPFPLSRFTDRRGDGSGLQAPVGRRDLWRHRDPVPAVQHPLSALRRLPADAQADRRGRHGRDDSRPAELLADRIARRRIHQCHDDAVRGCAVAVLGEGAARRARHPDQAAAAHRRARRAHRPAEERRVTAVCRNGGGGARPATTPDRRWRRSRRAAAAPSSVRAPGRCSARKSTSRSSRRGRGS